MQHLFSIHGDDYSANATEMATRSASDSAKQDGVRLKLNLKNLRRHDESITEIVESTSYVVMYSMTKDGSWVSRSARFGGETTENGSIRRISGEEHRGGGRGEPGRALD